jgi:hypothetical protein
MGEGVVVWVTDVGFVELVCRGWLDWETGEGTTTIGLGERGGVGGGCGLAEVVTNGESRIMGAEWVGFVELLVS